MRNCTVLTLHIIPNRVQHTISFQMAYNKAVCTWVTLTLFDMGLFLTVSHGGAIITLLLLLQ